MRCSWSRCSVANTGFVSTASNAQAGDEPGYISDQGYRIIRIDGCHCRAHRLAWLWVTGKWAESDIDHVNNARDDNRWCNLRLTTDSQNLANSKRATTNTSGFKGVSWRKVNRNWTAQIEVTGKYYHLGCFGTREAAFRAYADAAVKHFGEYAKPRTIGDPGRVYGPGEEVLGAAAICIGGDREQ